MKIQNVSYFGLEIRQIPPTKFLQLMNIIATMLHINKTKSFFPLL